MGSKRKVRPKSEGAEYRHLAETTLEPLIQLVDIDIQEACIAGDSEALAHSLEELVHIVAQTEFLDPKCIRVHGSKKHLKKKRSISHIKLEDLPIGTLPIGAFFSHDIPEEDIILALTKRNQGRLNSYGWVYAGIIPSLLSAQLENTDLSADQLSPRAAFLFNNIVRFREWIHSTVQSGNIADILDILPAFATIDQNRLGFAVGTWFANDPYIILHTVRSLSVQRLTQEQSEVLARFAGVACEQILKRNTDYTPIETTVATRARIERLGSLELISGIFERINTEFGQRWDVVKNTIKRKKRITIPAGDSLYMERLGIMKVEFAYDEEYPDVIVTNITLDDGFLFTAMVVHPDQRSEGWIEAFADSTRITPKRVLELTAYIEALLLDITKHPVGKGSKRPRKDTPAPQIARYFLRKHYKDPLTVQTHFVKKDDLARDHDTLDSDVIFANTRTLFDIVNPQTGEVVRTHIVMAKGYRLLEKNEGRNTKPNPTTAEQMHIDLTNILDDSRNPTAAIVAFPPVAQVSVTGALEAVVLPRL